jgi:hypothetical protein
MADKTKKFKVMCPGATHQTYGKFLFACTMEDDGKPGAMWLYCDSRDCKTWFKVEFANKTAKLTEMPKGYHFDFERLPVLAVKYAEDADA